MKNTLIILALAIFAATTVDAQSRKERKAMYDSNYNYEIESLGVGQDGTKLVKIWGYGKKADDAVFEAKKNAVAAVIFRGIPGGRGAAATPAILSVDGYEKNMDFFDDFFKAGGMYLSFVNSTTDGMPGGSDRIKMSKGYKVALSASVNYDQLRKYLEEKGIAKKMDAGF
jgi:hypothetical protein